MSVADQPAKTADDVRAWLTRVYGEDPSDAHGVMHVMACMRGVDGRLHVLKIGPDAPKSETDFFVLQTMRARADAVVTTAENIRNEHELSHDFVGPCAGALAAYRRELHGDARLRVVILSRSGDLPAHHPVWSDAADKLVLTAKERVFDLRARLPQHVAIEEFSGDLRSAIRRVEAEGAQTISIEAGPSTASALYGSELLVAQMYVSVFLDAAREATYEGRALPPDERLFGGYSCPRGAYETTESSGLWRFAQWVRAV